MTDQPTHGYSPTGPQLDTHRVFASGQPGSAVYIPPEMAQAPAMPTPQSSVGFSVNAKGFVQPEVKLYFTTPEEAAERGPQMLANIYKALQDAGLPLAMP